MDYDANGLADLILKPLYDNDQKGAITLKYLLQNAHIAAVSHHGKNAFSLLNMHIEVSSLIAIFIVCPWSMEINVKIGLHFFLGGISSFVLVLVEWENSRKGHLWLVRLSATHGRQRICPAQFCVDAPICYE